MGNSQYLKKFGLNNMLDGFICLDSSPLTFSLAIHSQKLFLLNGNCSKYHVRKSSSMSYQSDFSNNLSIVCLFLFGINFTTAFPFVGIFLLKRKQPVLSILLFPQPLLPCLELTSVLSAFKKLVFMIPKTFGFCVKLQQLKQPLWYLAFFQNGLNFPILTMFLTLEISKNMNEINFS